MHIVHQWVLVKQMVSPVSHKAEPFIAEPSALNIQRVIYGPDLETQPISINNQVEHREREETEPIT